MVLLAATALTPVTSVAAPSTPKVSVTLPGFNNLVYDSARNRVYASDSTDGRVYALDGSTGLTIWKDQFASNAFPVGLDVSPDGSTLAVAMYGLQHVQVINLPGGTIGPTMQPPAGDAPYSVRYGRPGRLYEVGYNNGPGYLHVFDTTTDLQVAQSTTQTSYSNTFPTLAITSNLHTLFVVQNGSGASDFEKFDVSTDSVASPVAIGFGGFGGGFTITPDGAQLFTNGGQAWDGGLQHLNGTFPNLSSNLNAGEPGVSYASGRVYVSVAGAPEIEVAATTGFPYHELGTIGVTGNAYANTMNSAGTLLYVSTSSDFEIIEVSQPLTPPPARNRTGWQAMVLDGAHGVLYASEQGAGYIDVISSTTGAIVKSIDVGETGKPTGMSLSPDGSTLAVALGGAWQIVLVSTSTQTVAGHMYPANSGVTSPWDVAYGRAGRLYETSTYLDMEEIQAIRIFDTTSKAQIGQFSNTFIDHQPWLAVSADGNDLYTAEMEQFSTVLHAFDISTDSPGSAVKTINTSGNGRIVARTDGAQVVFSGDQAVYSRLLASTLGTGEGGTHVAYAQTAQQLFFNNGGGTVSKGPFASPWTGGPGDIRPVAGANLIQVDATGTTVYVSVGSNVDIIKWGTPDPPTNVTAVHGNAQATISWNAPGYAGTSPINTYTITASPGGITKAVSGSTLSTVFIGLTNGTTYTFTIVATNATGNSAASAPSNAVTPRVPTVPTQPFNVSATAGHLRATVAWSPPIDNGDSAITGYTVRSTPGSVTVSAGPSATSAVVTGLSANTSYTFTVVATNGIGDSQPSAPSNSVVVQPNTVPGAPTGASAVAGNGQATVSWMAPMDDGGKPITGYTVTSSPEFHTAAAGPSATSVVVHGLSNGTTYTFRVTASNAIGTGAPSAPSNSATPFAPTVPGPPIDVTALGGHGQATVSWGAPATDGRSPITGYTVTSSPGGITASVNGTTLTAVVTGLTNGTSYTFTITAKNAVGTGPMSAPSNAVTPGAPSEPFITNTVAGVGSATITWSAPADTGVTPITQYQVRSSGGASAIVDGSTFTVTLAGLSFAPHTFTVTATNGDGGGPPSQPSFQIMPADGGTYNALTPKRILDTRTGVGGLPIRRVGPNQTITFQVTGQGGVPLADASAVVLNVTATDTTGPGFVTVYPYGSSLPVASNLNFVAGQTVPNLVEVPVGSGGKVSLYVGRAGANLIADVQGWVGDATNSYKRSGLFNPLNPSRVLDTRVGVGAPNAMLGPGQTLDLVLQGVGVVPTTGVSAVVLNVTVTNPTAASYLTVYPGGSARPLASNLNFVAGQTIANRVIVPVGPGVDVKIFNGAGKVNVIADITGWFTDATSTAGGAAFVPMLPSRLFDSRKDPPGTMHPGDIYFAVMQPWPEPITAVVVNFTATNESGPGFLTVFPDSGISQGMTGTPPLASDLNFVRQRTVANLVIVGLGGFTAFDFANGPDTTDVIIDMSGFYGAIVSAPPAGLLVPVREVTGPRLPPTLPLRTAARR